MMEPADTVTGSSVEDLKVIGGSSTTGCTESPSDFGGCVSKDVIKKSYIVNSSSSCNHGNSSSLGNIDRLDSYVSVPDDSVTCILDSKIKTDSCLPAHLPPPHTATVKLETLFRRKYNSFTSLANKSTSNWNDRNAHIIYSSLGIKRYYVDADYILCPDVHHDRSLKVSKVGEKYRVNGCTWSDIEPKIERILSIFDDTCKITDNDNQDCDFYAKIKNVVKENIYSLPPSAEPIGSSFRQLEKGFHLSLFRLLDKIGVDVRVGKNTPESVYENFLYEVLHLFFGIVGCNAKIKKTFDCENYVLEIDNLGHPQVPKPDFFLTTYRETLLAVVEVKPPPHSFAKYQGSSVPSCKRPKSGDLNSEDDDADAIQTKNEVLEMEDEEFEAEKENDEYEIIEGFAEAKRSADFPSHIRNLTTEEKKQMRCFLPQLLGQILACFQVLDQQCISDFKRTYAPLRLGIGVVGLKVRFVSVVLKDKKGAFHAPLSRDIGRWPSVKPHVYVTQELNLFNGRHLGIFFKTLFALCSLENNF